MIFNLMVDANGRVVGVMTSHVSLLVGGGTQNHHALHQYRPEEAVKTEIIVVGVPMDMVVSINICMCLCPAYLPHILCTSLSLIGVSCEWKHGSCRTEHNRNYAEVYGFTFRGVGYCTSRNGSTFQYETISWAKNIQQCATACVNRFSSVGNFRGINYLPAGSSSSNCNCMLGEDKITSAGSDDTELCYSYDGSEEAEPDPADSPWYPDCQDRYDKQECTDGYGDKKCTWMPGRPVGLCEDAPKETGCSGKGWQA